ncbi:hypothetical protein CC79DRAFT_1370624 [Sarocladium strictum]
MEKLNLDIFDLILDHIQSFTRFGILAPYVSVCRSWQLAIEARTMCRIYRDHQDDLETFSKIFSAAPSHRHRRRALRDLYFATCLPTMSLTPEDHERNNTCFQDSIIKLLNELGSWDSETPGAGPVRHGSLRLTLRWRTGHDSISNPTDVDWPPADAFLTMPDGFLNEVANVKVISQLEIFVLQGSAPHPRALCQLASKMTSLEHLELELWEPPLSEGAMRTEHHQALGTGILDFKDSLPNLSSLTLKHKNHQYFRNHSFECPSMTDEHGVDQLSRALRKLGKAGKLGKLKIQGLYISSDLFCERESGSAESKEQATYSTWPSLRFLDIRTGLVAANGQWLCTGNRDIEPNSPSSSSEDSEDSQQSPIYDRRAESPTPAEHAISNAWRRALDTTIFDPFVEDMVRAVTECMPSIEEFGFGISWNPPTDGELSIYGMKSQNVKRFQSQISTDWQLPETVVEMAKDWVGPLGIVKWRRYNYRDRYTGDWNYLTADRDT